MAFLEKKYTFYITLIWVRFVWFLTSTSMKANWKMTSLLTLSPMTFYNPFNRWHGYFTPGNFLLKKIKIDLLKILNNKYWIPEQYYTK